MSYNPFINRQKKWCHGSKAEEKLAKRLGAKLTPASGALDGAKGDMTLPEFRVESKATKNDSIRIKLDWLLKIAQEAIEKGDHPALVVQFVTEDGKPVKRGSWVMIPENTFKELLDQ